MAQEVITPVMKDLNGFYELLSTTNYNFTDYIGRKGTLKDYCGAFYFGTGNRYLRSSLVDRLTQEGDIFTFTTLNSTYVFKYIGESMSIHEFLEGTSD